MFHRLNKSAQSTLEYAVLLGVIAAGLIAMQTYLKGGFQGRMRSSADSIGEKEQFDPTKSTFTVTQNTDTVATATSQAGKTTSTKTQNVISNVTESINLAQ